MQNLTLIFISQFDENSNTCDVLYCKFAFDGADCELTRVINACLGICHPYVIFHE